MKYSSGEGRFGRPLVTISLGRTVFVPLFPFSLVRVRFGPWRLLLGVFDVGKLDPFLQVVIDIETVMDKYEHKKELLLSRRRPKRLLLHAINP